MCVGGAGPRQLLWADTPKSVLPVPRAREQLLSLCCPSASAKNRHLCRPNMWLQRNSSFGELWAQKCSATGMRVLLVQRWVSGGSSACTGVQQKGAAHLGVLPLGSGAAALSVCPWWGSGLRSLSLLRVEPRGRRMQSHGPGTGWALRSLQPNHSGAL